jgi:hypothetical protein
LISGPKNCAHGWEVGKGKSTRVARQVSRLRKNEDIKLDILKSLMKGFGLSLEISARKLESA